MAYPPPRLSKFDPELKWWEVDYENVFPIGNEWYQDKPFCRHPEKGHTVMSITPGQTLVSELAGEAPHDGGHCEWSISYDGVNFAVMKTIIGECMEDWNRHFEIPIPEGLPEGEAIIAWTWINRTGLREFYMNCADVYIEPSETSQGGFAGPKMFIGNLPGYPTIPMFTDTLLGEEYYEDREYVWVSPGEAEDKHKTQKCKRRGCRK